MEKTLSPGTEFKKNAGRRAQWVKLNVTKLYSLSSIPRTYMMEGKNWLLQVPLHACISTNKIKNNVINYFNILKM